MRASLLIAVAFVALSVVGDTHGELPPKSTERIAVAESAVIHYTLRAAVITDKKSGREFLIVYDTSTKEFDVRSLNE